MKNKILLILLLATSLLTACGPQSGETESEGLPLQAWFDAPLDGSILPEESYTLVFSGASFGEPIGNFEVFVNGVQEGTLSPLYQNSEGQAQYSYAEFDWLPPAPGNYLLQVRALTGDMVSPFADVSVVVGELVSEDDELPIAPVGEDVLVAIPTQNVNCRLGNSSEFDIVDTLFEGEQYTPEARGFDNLWVRFVGPVAQMDCWVFIDNLQLLLNEQPVDIVDAPEALLPFVAYPATPTPEPTATFTPEPPPQCSDSIDNDGDGRIDYGDAAAIAGGTADRECTSPADDDEAVR
jgi:hypothetical protein